MEEERKEGEGEGAREGREEKSMQN